MFTEDEREGFIIPSKKEQEREDTKLLASEFQKKCVGRDFSKEQREECTKQIKENIELANRADEALSRGGRNEKRRKSNKKKRGILKRRKSKKNRKH